jgi:RimJ/RimL family protein N-acetyltransferase
MDFNRLNQELKAENLFLKPITTKDRAFINGMFNDTEIKRYYIVPKEAQQDYRKLVDYWLNDIRNGAGTCWIINEKGTGIFARDKQVGFVAFEFRDTLKNARISYAILPEFRKKGFATTSVELIIKCLKQEGVERIEADIDRDNLNSEKVAEKLGFSANKRNALVDPEMMRDGEIRLRALWEKELVEFKKETTNGRIPLNASMEDIVPVINELVNEINSKGQHPKLMLRYFHLLGRIKFLERNYEEAQQAFGQCNMITMNEGLPEIHENYYWFAKINEAKGETGGIKMYLEFALEKYNENPNYISKSEIENEMDRY